MAVIPVKVKTIKTTRNTHWNSYGGWHTPVTVVRPSKESFVMLWQLADTLEDVFDSLKKAGCTDSWGDPMKIHTLKGVATRYRNQDKINLKELQSSCNQKESKEEKLKKLRFLAEAMLAFGSEAQELSEETA